MRTKLAMLILHEAKHEAFEDLQDVIQLYSLHIFLLSSVRSHFMKRQSVRGGERWEFEDQLARALGC